jgi:aryl-alcohol dehydrogenase-like predicted oxidoreductase
VAAPIVGATMERHIDDAVAGLELELTTEEITKLEAANTLVRNGII